MGETTHATQLRRLNQHRHHRQRLRRRHHQHLHPDVQTSLVIGRVRLEAHAPITYQSLIVLLMVAMVAMMVETVQMVPTATPMMVEIAVPMMQTGAPTLISTMPAQATPGFL